MKRLVVLVALAVMVMTMFAAISTRSEQTNQQFTASIEGAICGIKQFSRSPEIDTELTLEKLRGSGWIRTATHYQKTVILSSFYVAIDDDLTPICVDTNGQFKISTTPGVHTIHVFDADEVELIYREVFIEEVGETAYLPIVIVNDLENHSCCAIREHIDTGNMSHDESNESNITVLPCLDYNGPYGNCVNYSSGWRKYTNFVFSDCDLASDRGHCWSEFMPGHSCNHGGRNCSVYIGHSQRHHCH